DQLLLRWEQRMRGIDSLVADCTRAKVDKTYGGTEVFRGKAQYMKPNLANLYLVKDNKPAVYERFICSGNFLYQFVPEGKEIRVYELNQTKSGQVGEDNFLSFLFGMKAEEAKRRYDLRLEKQDQHWIYIRVYPRFDQDKVDFQEAQL